MMEDRLFLAVVVAIIPFVLIGCGGGPTPAPTPTRPTESPTRAPTSPTPLPTRPPTTPSPIPTPPGPTPPPPPPGNLTCSKAFEDTDCADHGSGSAQGIQTFEDCCKSCSRTPGCYGFSYVLADKSCYFKDSCNQKSPKKGVHSAMVDHPMTTTTTTMPHPGPAWKPQADPYPPSPTPPADEPIRGIAYGALPFGPIHNQSGVPLAADMLQPGYKIQWGPDGRDDLGMIRRVGANTVRLYHSLGDPSMPDADHSGFLDRAFEIGLRVQPGFHSNMYCPDNDCFESWYKTTKAGFERGYKKERGWHKAVHTLILLNEPDFCGDASTNAQCRVKKVISALEGVLAAEKEAGITSGPKLSTCWSSAVKTSIDGVVKNKPGLYGFQDIVATTKNPSLIEGYKPHDAGALLAAFKDRWTHCMNVAAPWDAVKGWVGSWVDPYNHGWMIGEMGDLWMTKSFITGDLEQISVEADKKQNFLGASFFQFQVAYAKGGSEMHFGIFSLGFNKVGDTGKLCIDSSCSTYPVWCLSTELAFADPPQDHRAEAVAAAWNGSTKGRGRCNPTEGAQSHFLYF